MKPAVSVVIRNRDENGNLGHVLKALRSQTVQPEIIVVDNESSDDSREVATAFGALIVSLKREEFTYGRALNIGIGAASAEIVVNLSAHALPLGGHFLESIVSRFDDPAVAAVRCNDIRFIDNHFEWASAKQIMGNVEWQEVWRSGIVNTCCGIRKSVWEEVQFDETLSFAEDPLWSHQVLCAGYVIRSSDAFYWYMARRRLHQSLMGLYREAVEQYRYSGTKRLGIRFVDVVLQCLWRIPKGAVRSAVDIMASYAAINLARYTARQRPFHARGRDVQENLR